MNLYLLLLYEIIITQKASKSQIFQGFLALFTFKKDKSEATSLGLCLQSGRNSASLLVTIPFIFATERLD